MSENKYPTYNQLQSTEDFPGTKHKLYRILPPGQTPTILPSHSSDPSWKNEQNFSPKDIVSTSDYYSRNFISDVHKNYKELSLWSNGPHNKTDIKDSKQNTSNIFSINEQQELMDLSSHPSLQCSKSSILPKVMHINGDMSRKQVSKNLNGETKLKKSDTESESAINVIASYSVNSKEFPNRTVCPKRRKEGTGLNSQESVNISEIILSKKQIVSSDNVESVLETMFYSDTKLALPTSTITSNHTLLKESVEEPIQLSPDATLELMEKSDSENKTSLERFSQAHPHESMIFVKCGRDKNSVLLKNETKIVNSSLEVTDSLPIAGKPQDSDRKIKSVSRIKVSSSGNKGIEDTNNQRSNAQHKVQQDTSTPNEKKIIKNEALSGNTNCQTVGVLKSKVQEDILNMEKDELKADEISYVEVESELAKMFAGIEDTASNRTELDSSQSLPIDAPDSMADPCQSSPHINPVEESGYQPAELLNNISIVRKSIKKKSSKKSKSNNLSVKNSKTKHTSSVKDNSVMDNAMTKRVPVIHIEGSKESPINVQIINSIKVEEEDSTDHKTSAKSKARKSSKAFKRVAIDYVLKNYDPGTSDASWICIFCNLSAYSSWISGEPSGDLFGPYFIRDVNYTDTKIDLVRESRMSDELSQVNQVKKKQKRSLSVESDYLNSSSAEQKTVEIWAHENCFVWAPGVHLVGSKLIGIEEAVWDALKTTCTHCGEKGASIGCRARHCKTFTHYGCAVFTGWKLDSKTFISTCNIHEVNRNATDFH